MTPEQRTLLDSYAPPWMRIALAELGVSEVAGPGDNPRIVAYHAATTLKATDDEVPWCSSFASWCMDQAGIVGTRSAAARSWLQWGREIHFAPLGSVVVFSRGNSPVSGHVGFVVQVVGPDVLVLGGNQGDRVSIAPFPRSRVLGFRWPA